MASIEHPRQAPEIQGHEAQKGKEHDDQRAQLPEPGCLEMSSFCHRLAASAALSLQASYCPSLILKHTVGMTELIV
ncbi:hypothetical protein FJY63_09690 [Candidatus Sumerlaeota bacterium]|nr:hypothetical protein [Candidatus Sumerlaeota bacterium]